MHRKLFRLSLLIILVLSSQAFSQSLYFPQTGNWETRAAAQAGFDPVKLREAIAFAVANESKAPRDMELAQAQTFGREPYGEPIGHLKTRGDMTGIILRNGYIVAEWGEPFRVDMTHSVTKSFLTVVVGLAFDRQLISELDSPVSVSMAPISVFSEYRDSKNAERFGKPTLVDLFESEHNRKISWDDLLRQTSDWEGTLWGKPDWADRPDRDSSTWLTRKRSEPGISWEYNDVRVNVLALAALNIWRRPLPKVLREFVMEEIGASQTWRWHGYENSFVLIDGDVMQSVSGGGHWGGGMFINARDMARFGLLIAREGNWSGKQIISKKFLSRAETPTAPQPTYGYMNFFLNTDKKQYASAPEGVIAFLGNGTNMVYIDRKSDLVIVARWIENGKIDEFLGKIYGSLNR